MKKLDKTTRMLIEETKAEALTLSKKDLKKVIAQEEKNIIQLKDNIRSIKVAISLFKKQLNKLNKPKKRGKNVK